MTCTPEEFFAVNRFLYDLLIEDHGPPSLATAASRLKMPLSCLRSNLIEWGFPTTLASLRHQASLCSQLPTPPPVYCAYTSLEPEKDFDDTSLELLRPVAPYHFDYLCLLKTRFSSLPADRLSILRSKWYTNEDMFADGWIKSIETLQTEPEFQRQIDEYVDRIPQEILRLNNDSRFLLNGQLSVAFLHGTVNFPVPGIASPHLRGVFRIGARQSGTGYLAIDTAPLPRQTDQRLLLELANWFRANNELYNDFQPLTVETLAVRLDPHVQGAAVVSARLDSDREPMSDAHCNVRIMIKGADGNMTATFVPLELALGMTFPLLFPFPLPRIPGKTFRQKACSLLSSHPFFRCGRLQCHLILFLYNLIEDQAAWFPQSRLSVQSLAVPLGTNRDLPGDIMFNDPSTESYWRKRQSEVRGMCHEFGDPDLMLTFTFVNKWPEVREAERRVSNLYGSSLDIRFCPLEAMTIWKNRFSDCKAKKFQNLITAMGFGRVSHYVWRLEFQARGAPHVHALIWLSSRLKLDTIAKSMFAVRPPSHSHLLSSLVIGPMIHECSVGRCKKGDPTLKCKYGFPKPSCASPYITETGELYLPRGATEQWIVEYSPGFLLKWRGHCHVHVLRTYEHPECSPNAIQYIVKYNFKSEPTLRVEAAHDRENYQTLFHSRVTSSEEAIARIFSFDYHRSDTPSIFVSLRPPDSRTAAFVAGEQVQLAAVDKYYHRPPQLSQLRIQSFFSLYDVFPTPTTNSALLQDRDPPQDVPARPPGTLIDGTWEQRNLPPLRLIDEGLLQPSEQLPNARALACRLRQAPMIVLTNRFSLSTDQETIAYAALLLSGSWRADSEILSGCSTYCDALSYHGLQPLELDELSRNHRALMDYMLATTRYTPYDIAQTASALQSDLRPYLASLLASSDTWRQARLRSVLATLDTLENSSLDPPDLSQPVNPMNLRTFINTCFTPQEVQAAALTLEEMLPLLNHDQQLIFTHVSTALGLDVLINIFVSGKAGTGKSFLIRLLQAYFTTINVSYVTCASTGIAANLIKGRTVHSTFRIYDDGSDNLACGLDVSKPLGRAISLCKLIIIDEVTMIPRQVLEALDRGLKRLAAQVHGRPDLPFGGKHVLLFGDLAQVPAVVRARDDFTVSANQFFEATPYAYFTRFCLPMVMRQNPDETEFLSLLSDIRDTVDRLSPQSVQLLRSRFTPGVIDDVINDIDDFVGHDSPDGLVITFTNTKAQHYNSLILRRRLPADSRPFRLDATFCVRQPPTFLARPFRDPSTALRHLTNRLATDSEIRIFFGAFRRRLINTIIPAHLEICRGARVMLLQNIDPAAGLINGARGTVVDYLETPDAVAVRFDNDAPDRPPTLVTRRSAVEYPLSRGQHIFMLQFPLKLCWAVTAHKAQGQTLSRIAIDISENAFAHGALYVALSRVRSLASVRLFGLPEFPDEGPSFHINPYIHWQDQQPPVNSVCDIPQRDDPADEL